jgi:hypothetical protein
VVLLLRRGRARIELGRRAEAEADLTAAFGRLLPVFSGR